MLIHGCSCGFHHHISIHSEEEDLSTRHTPLYAITSLSMRLPGLWQELLSS